MTIKERNPIVCILLSLVTCGIYGFYWVFCMAREAVSIKDPNDAGTLEALLCIFFAPAGFFLAEKKFAEGCAAKGVEHKDNSVLYLILCLVCLAIVPYYMMQTELNKFAVKE
ncbi:MAG: DUF4234 domain-containing protein [Clostridia bacterium]|nr:DUF4234 domain-containing protein [Clostridia bacterium]